MNITETDTDCPLCSGDYPADFVEAMTSATATIGAEMNPEAFHAWLMDETCASDF